MKFLLAAGCCTLLLYGCALENEGAIVQDAIQRSEMDCWIPRDPLLPLNATEKMVLEMATVGSKAKSIGRNSIYIVEDIPPTMIVAVEESPATPEETLIKKTLYRLEGDTLADSCPPEFVQVKHEDKDKPQRAAAAREVAFQAKNGTLPIKPLLYLGKYAYSTVYKGGCTVVVTEKNTKREVIGNYEIKVCEGESD